MIEFKNVFIKYIPAFYSLYNFNCSINSNTLVVGDAVNGSKAIFRIISKIDKQYTGDVFIDNVNIKNINDKDLNVAYVPEKFELFKFKNVEKNLTFPLIFRKFNKKQAKIMAFDLLKQYNLENFLKTKAFKLDKDLQKIICLLRAVVRKPSVILLEDFFKDLNNKYFELASNILSDATRYSIIIASEETDKNLKCFTNFNRIALEKSDE